MNLTMSPAILDELLQAVSDVDRMMVVEEINNDRERSDQRGYSGDATRIARYQERRKRIRDHRERLQTIYMAITGENPWADIPF